MKIDTLVSQAKNRIQKGYSEKAISILLSVSDALDDIKSNALILISNQLRDVQRKKNLGLESDNESLNRINNALLSIADELLEENTDKDIVISKSFEENIEQQSDDSSEEFGTPQKWFCQWELGTKIYDVILELKISNLGNVIGERFLTYRDQTDKFKVTGVKRGSFFKLAYHKEFDRTGGGVMILHEFVAGKLRGTVTYQNCDTGNIKCLKNEWIDYFERHNYKLGKQDKVGEIELNR